MGMAKPQGWAPWVLVAVAVGYFALLVLWPVVAVVQGAFIRGPGPMLGVLARPDVQHAFMLTLALAAGAVGVNTVMGTLIAWVLVRQRFFGRGLLNGLIDLPFVVSPVIAGYMVLLLFGRQGWLASWPERTGFQVAYSLPGMLLVTIFVSLPFTIRELMPILGEIGVEPEQQDLASEILAQADRPVLVVRSQ